MKTKRDYRFKLMRKNPHCHYCGIQLVMWPKNGGSVPLKLNHNGRGYATLDHKKARVNGGGNEKENFILCCSICNSEKGSMSYDRFMALKRTVREKRKGAQNDDLQP